MATVIYPLPLGDELASNVRRTAAETGLSQAEVMRQAIAFGLVRVRKALRKDLTRLTAVAPLSQKEARALYRLADDDREQIDQLMAAQRFEGAE